MAGPKTTITGDRTLSHSRSVLNELAKFDALSCEMVIKGTYPTRGESVAKIVFWHEFGTAKMVARPLLRQAQRSTGAVVATTAQALNEIKTKNRKAETAAQHIAQKMASLVVEAVQSASGWAAPLKDSTIAKKGHSAPLLDSGLLLKSIYWRVTKSGAIVREGRAQ